MHIGNPLYGINGMARTGRPKKAQDEKFDRVTLTLPPGLLDRARERAEQEGVGVSTLVARGLELVLSEKKTPGKRA